MSDPSSTSNEAVGAMAAGIAAAAAEWPTDPSCYELVGKIGHGAFATVWMAMITTNSTRRPGEDDNVL